jgi:hypothetical protein
MEMQMTYLGQTELDNIRARDAESGETWFTGPASFTAQGARDRRALLGEVDRLVLLVRQKAGEAILAAQADDARVVGLREAAQRLRALFPTETKTVNAFEVTKVFIDRTNGEALMDALTALDVALAGTPSEGRSPVSRYHQPCELHRDTPITFTTTATCAVPVCFACHPELSRVVDTPSPVPRPTLALDERDPFCLIHGCEGKAKGHGVCMAGECCLRRTPATTSNERKQP